MSDGALRALALALAAGALAMSAAAAVLFWLTPGLDFLSGWGFVGYDAVFAVVYVAVGLLIVTRRPRNLIAWLFLASAVMSGIQTLTGAYSGYALAAGAPAGDLAGWITGWIWIPAVGVIVLTLLLFPDSRLPSPAWRWAAWGLLPLTVLPTLLWALASPDAEIAQGGTLDPLGLSADHPLRAVAGPSVLLLSGMFVAAAAALASRMRSGDAVVRQQVKWVAFASALVAFTLGSSVYTSLAAADHPLTKLTQVLAVIAVLLIPLAATVAILRYRLYDIDILINRTLVYGAVSTALLATYLGAVVLFQALLRPFTSGSELAVAGSTLLVVALFQPLRRRVQGAVDRRFYRARYDAARTLDAFAARLRDEVDLDSVRASLVGVLDQTVRPAHASVWLRQSDR